MNEPLLQTKLFIPPVQPNLVPRPRLIRLLDEAINQNCRLVLVSAAAGFGKSTLLSEWVHGGGAVEPSSMSVAWLSLDSGDNDLVRFLAYFIGALQTIECDLGQGALDLLQSPEPPVTEMVVTALINEIAELSRDSEVRPFVLILDDFHRIDALPVHETLIFLLEHLPPRMHLVIASRTDPPLALPRLRVRGELVELREADLRFNSEETTTFFDRTAGISLSAENITALDARTEGWIAGLQVAALSMKGHDDVSDFVKTFTGSHRYVMDYLVDEVLIRQPQAIQTFLLNTAILDQMTGPLCDALTDQSGGQETLEKLDRDNLFIIPLDSERRWYRYHHLFADLLRSRLDQTRPDRTSELHRRASKWFELSGYVEEAAKHSLAAADYGRAAQIIENLGDVLWERGEPTTLLRWLEALPDEEVLQRPSLCNFHAWTLYMNGQNQAAESRLQAAERLLHSPSDPSLVGARAELSPEAEFARNDQMGRAAAIRASMASRQGDIPAIIHYSNLALDTLPESSLMWRTITTIALGFAQDLSGDQVAAYQTFTEAVQLSQLSDNIYLIMSTNLHLGNILSLQGRLNEMFKLCQELQQVAAKRGVLHTEMAGCLYDELGLISSEWNELDQAMDYLKKGSNLSRQGYDVGVLGYSYLTMLRALYALGDNSSAQGIIQEMELMERESDVPPWFNSPKEAWKGRFLLLAGDLEAAAHWAVERGLKSTDDPTYMREEEYIALARILVAQDRSEEALELLDKLRELAEEGGRQATVIKVSLLEALAYQSQGDPDRAMITLERALSLAEPAGAIRLFLDEREPMADLLRAFNRWPGREGSTSRTPASQVFLNSLLDGFKAESFAVAKTELQDRFDKSSVLVEALSDREIEVLRLLAAGLSYREIAEALFVSINTIKAHAKNIYSKLGVHGRVQAMHRATELNLL